MIKITKTEVLTKEVLVEFSNKEPLKILLNTFLELSLYENKEITPKDYQNIKEKDEFFRVKDYAYYLLKFRDYCEREMEYSLYKYCQNEIFVQDIIKELKKKNYINDEAYAKYAVEKMFYKQFSKVRVIKELESLDIDENIIYTSTKDYDEYEILEKKINYLFKKYYSKKTLENAKKDVYQKCLIEGFDLEIVQEILTNLELSFENNIDHDHEMLLKDYLKIKRNYQNDCDNNEFKVKLIHKLTSKGYSYDAVMNVLRKDELEND